MTLDTFFEKFDLFADAPVAVAKMRELVLELAVQGKLVAPSSNPDKHPAWLAFRKEISERVYSYDPGPPPFEIPEHWEWCVIDDVAKSCGQKTPDEKFTYIDVGSIDNTCGKFKPELNIVEAAKAPSRARKLALPGSVIYATVRPYLKNIAVIDKDFSPPAIISTAFAILHPLSFIQSRYLFYWLRSSSFEREVSAYAKGVAYPAISDSDLKGCFIPIPPLDEQKRIVAKVDELMALCDRLEAQQQEREQQHTALSRASLARFADAPTPANLQLLFHKSYTISPADLRKSILTLAVQGKLVAQDPGDEPPQLPDGAQNIEDSEWVSRLQLPALWNWTRLESILAILKNGFNGKPSKVPGKFKVTRIETIARETIDLTRVGYADDLPGDIVAKHAISKGDILFSHINSEPHLGKTAICTIDDPMLIHGVNLLLIRPIAGVDSRYLNIAFRELRASSYFVSIAQRAVNQASINQKNLGKTAIPIPPLAEQRRIAAKVDQLMAIVDELETQLAASRATAKNLLDSLVAVLTNGSQKAS